MSSQSVTNIISEDMLTSLRNALDPASKMKVVCIGSFNPLSRKACEIIETAHETVHRFQFIKQSNPVIVVPLFKKLFRDDITWESSMCGLSNHRLVDYVVNVERCSTIDIVDRFSPDFIFLDRSIAGHTDLEMFAKKMRIKLIRV